MEGGKRRGNYIIITSKINEIISKDYEIHLSIYTEINRKKMRQ